MRERFRLILLTSSLEVMVLGSESREAARAADLLLRGEDREKEAEGEERKYIGSWIIHTQTGEVIEAYGPRCIGVDPGEYGYKRKQLPDGLID